MLEHYTVEESKLIKQNLETLSELKGKVDEAKGNREEEDKLERYLLDNWQMCKMRIDIISMAESVDKKDLLFTKRNFTVLNSALLYMIEQCPEVQLAQVGK